jgi:hypothetical protein
MHGLDRSTPKERKEKTKGKTGRPRKKKIKKRK